MLVIASIQTPIVCPSSIRYRLYRINRDNLHVLTMPVYSTVRVLILWEKWFSELDSNQILKKNYQLWPKFLLNPATVCCAHHSYRHLTSLNYNSSKVFDILYENILSLLHLYLSFSNLRHLNVWSMKILCRNSDFRTQRTESVCLTKTNQLKLFREIIDVYYASHVQYEHLYVCTLGKLLV